MSYEEKEDLNLCIKAVELFTNKILGTDPCQKKYLTEVITDIGISKFKTFLDSMENIDSTESREEWAHAMKEIVDCAKTREINGLMWDAWMKGDIQMTVDKNGCFVPSMS
jgi:hypothetical protein